jgi:hypothetical protein
MLFILEKLSFSFIVASICVNHIITIAIPYQLLQSITTSVYSIVALAFLQHFTGVSSEQYVSAGNAVIMFIQHYFTYARLCTSQCLCVVIFWFLEGK